MKLFITLGLFIISGVALSQPIAKDMSEDIESFLDLKNKNFMNMSRVTKHTADIYVWETKPHLADHPDYGKVPWSSSVIRVIQRTQDKIIFDATYTTDNFFRRANISFPNKAKSKSLVIAGCSFVFGVGLNDQDTLNNIINRDPTPYYAYSYGVPGGSLNIFLARLMKEENLSQQLHFEKSDLVYLYIDDHIARAVGTWPNLWTLKSPYFRRNEKNEIEHTGNIAQNMSWLREKAVRFADSLPNFLKENRVIPRLSSADYDYYCELVKEVDRRWKTRKNPGRFLFVFHPLQAIDSRMIACLRDNNIEHMTSKVTIDNSHLIPIDLHPTGSLNKVLAREILDHLAKR